MDSHNKRVTAVADDYFVVKETSWIVTLDAQCREIKRMGSYNKAVRQASGDTFTVDEGG